MSGVDPHFSAGMGELAAFFAADLTQLAEPEMILRLVLQVVLFVATAFFSGSETALFSLSRLDLRRLRRERNPLADTLHGLLDQPRRLIISILCGNQIVIIAATANMTAIAIQLYGFERAAWISSLLMVPLLLLFGEVTPKTIAVSDPVGVSTRLVARPMRRWLVLAAPLHWAVRSVADRLTTAIVGAQMNPDNLLRVDEFRTMVDEGVLHGELSADERAMIYNLLKAGSAEIVEIMTPRTRIAFIDGDLPPAAVIEQFLRLRHSCVPVFQGSRDNVIGFLLAETVLELIVENKVEIEKLKLNEVLRPPVMVPLTKKIDEMFDYFSKHETQAAVVLDEFGGIDGLITFNDVLTYVFGRPHTELPMSGVGYDPDADVYDVPGDMKLIDFNNLTHYGIDDERMTTVGGIVLRLLDRLPQAGDTVTLGDIRLSVVEMDGSRIARVHAGRASAAKSGSTGESP